MEENIKIENVLAKKKIVYQYIELLKMKINTPDMLFLKKYHPAEFNNRITEYVPVFSEEYPFLVKSIINGDDLSMLDTYFNKLTEIENGTLTLEDARNALGMELHNKYVADKIK